MNFKTIYDENKTLKKFDEDQNWENRVDNVLSYLQDYNYIDHIDKNKLTQSIIHWSLADNNDYIFNLYNGFGGILQRDTEDSFYKIPHLYANTPNLSIKDYDEHSNNIRWCNIVKLDTKKYDDKLFISSAIEYFILQNQKYYSKFGDKKWVKNIYYTSSKSEYDINAIVLQTDIENENDDICKYLFNSSNYSNLIQKYYFVGHLVLEDEKIGLAVIGDDVNQIPSITIILYKNMLKKITITNFKNIKFHDENSVPINFFYEPGKNRYNEYLYDTINIKYTTYFYELQNILTNGFSLPFIALLDKSIRAVKSNSPLQKTTECYYIKYPYSPSYMLRYSGKIKPTFISKDSIDAGYFNFKFYKKYANDLNEIKDNNVLEETNFNAKYPSINYYPLIKRIQKYDIINEYNYEDNNVLNDDSIKYNYTDLNFFNDNYMYVLKPQMNVKLHSKKDEFGNYVKLKDLIKEYLSDFYNVNHENDTIKQKTVDYIFNQYTYTSTFDYASNDIKDIDNYIYDVKIILK